MKPPHPLRHSRADRARARVPREPLRSLSRWERAGVRGLRMNCTKQIGSAQAAEPAVHYILLCTGAHLLVPLPLQFTSIHRMP